MLGVFTVSTSSFSLGKDLVNSNPLKKKMMGKNMALSFFTVHAQIQKVLSEGVQF